MSSILLHSSVIGLLLLAAPSSSLPRSALPPRPRQTSYQQEVMARISLEAELGSERAEREVLDAFGDEDFRMKLEAFLPETAEWTAFELLRRFRAELAVAEIIHNLPARAAAEFNAVDVDLGILNESEYLMNQWELAVLFRNHTDPFILEEWMAPQDATETGLYGMRPFSGSRSVYHGRWPASYAEAGERPVYNSLNLMRVDMGVADLGPIALLLRRPFVENMTVLSPVDTGDFEDMCNDTFTHELCSELLTDASCAKIWFCRWSEGHCDSMQEFYGPELARPACNEWNRMPGTLAHYYHLILANVKFWNRTDSNRSRSEILSWRDNLALRVARLLSPWKSLKVEMREAFHQHYWEANTLGTPLFPHAVQVVLGDFTVLFGTEDGIRLQLLCKKWGWALIWSLGPNLNRSQDEESTYTGNYSFMGNKRILDPLVLSGGTSAACNMTGTVLRSVVATFHSYWDMVSAAREQMAHRSSPFPTPHELEQWWLQLSSQIASLRVEPLRASSCADLEACFAVTEGGDCVCYDSCRVDEAEHGAQKFV